MTCSLRKLFSITIGAVLFSTSAQAQANFRPGYVIPMAGDTVRGQLDYSGGRRVNYQCRFRESKETNIVTYTPSQLRGYGFPNDRIYQALRVAKSIATGDSSTQRLFLEELVQGAVSLYAQLDTNGDQMFYVQAGGGKPTLLTTKIVTAISADGSEILKPLAVFRGVLAEAFRGCPAVQVTTGNLTLKASSLVAAVRQYNDCVGGQQQVSAVALPRRRRYFILEAVAGVQASTLRFVGEVPVRDVSLAGAAAPVVGFAAQLRSSVSANRLSLRVEALYERQRYDHEYQNPYALYFAAYQEVRIRLDRLRMPVLLRYSPLNTRLQPYLEAGGSVALTLTNTNEYRYRSRPTIDYSRWNAILTSSRPIEQGFLAGVGLAVPVANKHLLSISLRVERSNGFSQAIGIQTEVNRFYFLVNYALSKPR